MMDGSCDVCVLITLLDLLDSYEVNLNERGYVANTNNLPDSFLDAAFQNDVHKQKHMRSCMPFQCGYNSAPNLDQQGQHNCRHLVHVLVKVLPAIVNL